MAAREYVTTARLSVQYDNSTTTAILEYQGDYVHSTPPFLPFLPNSYYYYDKNPNGGVQVELSTPWPRY
ncbi:hypothetical protein H5410_023206 [Solanum commersonii]|uniref:Uncharacterized protein n=1 Tax=Solanum commersonii TaxID=4109 RepID=A0A9J5ZHM1_SOLCO|nr:hypothetical protein H5410_023206 [Solanum commersonii]